MKTKITEVKRFNPIKIELTIETEEELREWYARCNASMSTLMKGEAFYDAQKSTSSASDEMFCIVEEILDNLNKPE